MTYLKGINALRFLAAMLVLIFHCNDGLRQVNLALFRTYPILTKGTFAVDFFFVISGFLLSYLAFHEIKSKQRFNLGKFFMRRILRIFPLYYLGVFLGFFLMGVIYPKITGQVYFDFDMFHVVWYYLGLLPNYVIVNWNNIGPMYSLWSIGVEEQFYLIFPLLILAMVKLRRELSFALILLVFYFSFYLLVYYHQIAMVAWLRDFIVLTLRFHFIFAGVILGAALVYYKESRVFKFIEKKPFQIISMAAFVLVLLFIPTRLDPHNLLGTLLFIPVMVNCARDVSILDLEQRPISYLGKISYGIYVFHPFVSVGLRYFIERLDAFRQLVLSFPMMFYVMVSIITFVVAGLSFAYYESYFLRLKRHFK